MVHCKALPFSLFTSFIVITRVPSSRPQTTSSTTWEGESETSSIYYPTVVEDFTSTPAPSERQTCSPAPPARKFSPEEKECIERVKGRNYARSRKAVIACLFPFNPNRMFSVQRVRPAIAIAIEKVTSRGMLSSHFELEVNYRDSKCSISDAMNEAVNFFTNNRADVYFGPTCDYAAAPVARQVRYWNIAMVTAGAMAGDFGLNKHEMFPMLTRVGTNFNAFLQFITSILEHFKWKKVKLFYNPNGYMDIMDRYCHLAVDGVHHGLRVASAFGHVYVEQDHTKFYDVSQALRALPVEIGNRFAERTLQEF